MLVSRVSSTCRMPTSLNGRLPYLQVVRKHTVLLASKYAMASDKHASEGIEEACEDWQDSGKVRPI